MNQRSWYARLLRLRRTDLNGYFGLVLFEGSGAVALLLALGGLMTPWSVVAVPVAIAVMVKYFDVITSVLARPAVAAQLRPARPQVAVGRSPVPGPSRLTTWIEADDAVPYPPVARGVASVSPEVRGRRPAPRVRRAEADAPIAPPVDAEIDPRDDPLAQDIGAPDMSAAGPVWISGDELDRDENQITGALTYNTAAMRMRGNQGRFG